MRKLSRKIKNRNRNSKKKRKERKSRKSRKTRRKKTYKRKSKSLVKKINKKGKGNSNINNAFIIGNQNLFEEQPCFKIEQGGRGFCWMASSMILLLSASYRGLIKLHPHVENFLNNFKIKFYL